MVTRDFDAVFGVRPTFRVGGQTFTVKARLQNKKYRALIEYMTRDDKKITEDDKVERFFRTVLIKADQDRFVDLYNADDDDDEENCISAGQLDDVMGWVLEHITGKAPSSSESSEAGVSETPTQRNVVSLNARTQAG